MPEKRWLRIIPVAFIMYTIAFVDRTNISLALQPMILDLHMSPTQAGDAAGVFFWGYLLLQVPGVYLAHRWSAKRFVSVLLVIWGACSAATGLVTTWREFWMMRLRLGVAEGGVWPATLVLLSNWFPRAERARANAYWMLCLPASVIFSSPLSGWILGHWNWRVLLISEGALPFLWLVVWWYFISDHPHQARWISAEERDYLETTLRRESSELQPATPELYLRALLPYLRALPHVVLMVGIYFLVTSGNYGYLFWLPSALQRAKTMSNVRVGFLFAVPYVMTAIGMVLISRHSDRSCERRKHVALALAWGGVLLLSGVLASNRTPALSFVVIALVGAGTYGMLGPFWAIPTETLPRSVAGSAMGLINALGNLGGRYGPLLVGYLNQRTGDFLLAFGVLSASFLGASVLSLLPASSPHQNTQPRRL